MRRLFVLALAGCESFFPLESNLEQCIEQGYEPIEFGDTVGYYRISVPDETWISAEAACRNDGPTSHLVVLGSSAERGAVFGRAHSEIDAQGLTSDTLIGLSNLAPDGQYRWVSNEPAVVPPPGQDPWAMNEPEAPENNHCVLLLFSNGNLASTQCDAPDPYVCECDAFQEQPDNF
jgi:hypothetical protein